MSPKDDLPPPDTVEIHLMIAEGKNVVEHPLADDLTAIARIDAVPTILDVVCRTTGMGFAAVARVTEDRWIACAVRDEIAFGLQPGGELEVETTICDEIRDSGQPVVIDHVAEDAAFCGHPTPTMYGFQSYISMPIHRRRRPLLRHAVRHRSPAGRAQDARDDRHVQAVRRPDRLPSRRAGAPRGQREGRSWTNGRPRSCASSSSPSSATTCAIRWPRSTPARRLLDSDVARRRRPRRWSR